MSGIDLTEAIKAAHNPVFDAMITDGPDGHVDGYEQIATAAVTAAAPLIEAAVREKVAAEIEEARYNFRRLTATTGAADLISRVYDDTARIARNGSPS